MLRRRISQNERNIKYIINSHLIVSQNEKVLLKTPYFDVVANSHKELEYILKNYYTENELQKVAEFIDSNNNCILQNIALYDIKLFEEINKIAILQRRKLLIILSAIVARDIDKINLEDYIFNEEIGSPYWVYHNLKSIINKHCSEEDLRLIIEFCK